MQKGHPWVTADGYTARYPKDAPWLMGKDAGGRDFGLLLHDPEHPHVKARLWALEKDLPQDTQDIKIWFRNELAARLQASFRRRAALLAQNQRQNVYLAFGEADGLPGIFAQIFAGQVVIQVYSAFWIHWQNTILQEVQKELPGLGIWWQERSSREQSPPVACGEGTVKEITCLEYGVRYKVRPDSAYDQGLYTDMAQIRHKLMPHYPTNAKVLNLFCYTGAFSLHALSLGAVSVVSVDLSKKYLAWLDENLLLNPQLDPSRHVSLNQAVERALNDLRAQGQSFDVVICDPPSASSDGNKTTQALKAYESLMPAILDVTAPAGKILACLNTHHVGRQKFQNKLKEQFEAMGKPARIQESWSLGSDCPLMPHFPEGDYLKALLIQKRPSK